MRALILIAAVALASCGGNGTVNNAAVSEQRASDEMFATNDATAIDAATGEAADMAADVNYTFNEAEIGEPGVNAASNASTNASANNSL
ncbi:MAG TPA: hypothetical protein VFU80_01240 [Sphingomicrobium sp.]|nr:hypothetical protein [Sphingomicrobium sp.]